MGTLQINVLGESFAVQAREDDAYLNKLLSYYRDITETIQQTGIKNPLQASILAGITLVDELYKEKAKNVSYAKALSSTADGDEAERLTLGMIATLDKALE